MGLAFELVSTHALLGWLLVLSRLYLILILQPRLRPLSPCHRPFRGPSALRLLSTACLLLLLLQPFDLSRKESYAVFHFVFIPLVVFRLASLADDLGEAIFIFVMIYLVTGHCHFIALIADHWFERAHLTMLIQVLDVKPFPTVVGTLDESQRAVLANVVLKLVKGYVIVLASVWTSEPRVL